MRGYEKPHVFKLFGAWVMAANGKLFLGKEVDKETPAETLGDIRHWKSFGKIDKVREMYREYILDVLLRPRGASR